VLSPGVSPLDPSKGDAFAILPQNAGLGVLLQSSALTLFRWDNYPQVLPPRRNQDRTFAVAMDGPADHRVAAPAGAWHALLAIDREDT
jgi:hypothetical protein